VVIAQGAGGSGGPVGGSAAQQAAKTELHHSEYHQDGPGPLTRALHWIGRQIGRLFDGSGGSHALLVALVLVLAVAVIVAVRAGAPGRRQRSIATRGADPLASVAAHDHRRIAEQLTAQGRRAEALREWLRAAVATIEERGVLPVRPGRTGATTAREAGPLLPSAADDLRLAMAGFDEVWFGGRDALDADVAQARAAADAVAGARVTAARGSPTGLTAPW
jgi:hypothetical protein